MNNNYFRSMMESIDDIYNDDTTNEAEEIESDEVELSPQEVIKDIISSLKEITNQVANDSIPDMESFMSDLKNISSTLKELISTDEDEADADSDFDTDTLNSTDDLEEECGTEGMGPRVDRDHKQHYENPQGSSYAAKKGFVGM